MLEGRFEIGRVLGSGGFGITYLARDLERRDHCVVKELAPVGAVRVDGTELDLSSLGPAQAQRLRHQFLQEAKALRKLAIRGILPMRDAFHAHQTAYLVVDYVEGAMDLGRVMQAEGPMDAQGVLDIILALLETLEKVHEQGILHRDLKPTNILLGPKGDVILIDFGSAREWHAAASQHHTVQFTPGYAPIEQMSERARRGPATDLYGLCATAYALLTGSPPPASSERAAGVPMIPLRELRADLEVAVASALEAGLAMRYEDRPADAGALRALLLAQPEELPSRSTLELLDEKVVLMQRMNPAKRECPSCHQLLAEPKPLKPGVCPVCRAGVIQVRKLSERLCPSCKVGILRVVRNEAPLTYCPVCRFGRLQSKGLLGKKSWTCKECEEKFEARGEEIIRTATGEGAAWREWRIASRRSSEVLCCDSCPAQLDHLQELGVWELARPAGPYSRLTRDEWTMVAAGIDPAAGNAECDSCGADYFCHENEITLLEFSGDDFGFGDRHRGQLLHQADLGWIGAGKDSGNPGPLCAGCGTEFDLSGSQLTLVATRHSLLGMMAGETHTIEDWHRAAQGLPWMGSEHELIEALERAIVQGFREGDVPFSDRDESLIWKGDAALMAEDAEGWSEVGTVTLLINEDEVRFTRILRKQTAQMRLLRRVELQDDIVILAFGDGLEMALAVTPLELSCRLESGNYRILLTADDLVARLGAMLA